MLNILRTSEKNSTNSPQPKPVQNENLPYVDFICPFTANTSRFHSHTTHHTHLTPTSSALPAAPSPPPAPPCTNLPSRRQKQTSLGRRPTTIRNKRKPDWCFAFVPRLAHDVLRRLVCWGSCGARGMEQWCSWSCRSVDGARRYSGWRSIPNCCDGASVLRDKPFVFRSRRRTSSPGQTLHIPLPAEGNGASVLRDKPFVFRSRRRAPPPAVETFEPLWILFEDAVVAVVRVGQTYLGWWTR